MEDDNQRVDSIVKEEGIRDFCLFLDDVSLDKFSTRGGVLDCSWEAFGMFNRFINKHKDVFTFCDVNFGLGMFPPFLRKWCAKKYSNANNYEEECK